MKFLYANEHELAALQELPYIQRIVYLMGMRPYMDRQSCIVGIKRRISYQSLREMLYVGPIAGVKTGSPSLQQMKRAVKSLERAGLIVIQSTERHLIIKCIFAELDNPPQNKAKPKPNQNADTNPTQFKLVKSRETEVIHKIPDTANPVQADPPQKSEIYFVCVYTKFEKFWQTYPHPTYKRQAFEQFKKINPYDKVFDEIMRGLKRQLEDYKLNPMNNALMKKWQTPAGWLQYQGWKT